MPPEKKADAGAKDAPVETETPDDLLNGSSLAELSTYAENTDLPATNPPAGAHVLQTLGTP